MNKKILLPLLCAAILSGCNKTKELYKATDYNNSVFDENYYLEYDGLDVLNLNKVYLETTFESEIISDEELDIVSLSKIDDSFKEGIISKLYDGRTSCGGRTQLSRVQANKTGFGSRFPLTLQSTTGFDFVARGGTSSRESKLLSRDLVFDFEISLYTNTTQYIYKLSDVTIKTDNYPFTTHVSFPLGEEAKGVIGFSMKFNCNDTTREDTTDDMNDKEKDHLSLMVYEVFLRDSSWSK